MSKIKQYALAILGALVAVALGIVGALVGLKRSREQKCTSELAVDLAEQNAARAREQAKASTEAIDAKAAKAIEAKDIEAKEDSEHVSSSGNLAQYLNSRS